MKIGLEAEGRLKGIKTLFIEAHESFLKALEVLKDKGIGHIYISDQRNLLSYAEITYVFRDYHVTLDITRVKDDWIGDNISIMFRVDLCLKEAIYNSILNLKSERDQIKIEKDRHVFVFPMNCAMIAIPDDFAGDVEV